MNAASPHRLLNPSSLAPARGFSHAVVASPGRTVWLGGQTGVRPDGSLPGVGLLPQFEQACKNVVEALLSAGARPEHMVSVTIYVSDLHEYRSSLEGLGGTWQRHFGKHYPAVSLFQVSGFFEPGVLAELVVTAVVPG